MALPIPLILTLFLLLVFTPPFLNLTGGTCGLGPLFGGGPLGTPPFLYARNGKNFLAVSVSVGITCVIASIGFLIIGSLSPPVYVVVVGCGFLAYVVVNEPDNLASAVFLVVLVLILV
jgi:hypothetical protein